jgi:hypothetical protein
MLLPRQGDDKRGEAYFSGVEPGVELVSSGEGWMCPPAFSGVLERTEVGPGPAVEGSSPRGPEGSMAW